MEKLSLSVDKIDVLVGMEVVLEEGRETAAVNAVAIFVKERKG